MVKKAILLSIVAAMFSLVGCVTPSGLAPSTVPITGNDSYTIVKNEASGTDAAMSILFIPVNTCSAYNALQEAKKVNGADALINVRASSKTFNIFIMSWEWITIYGDAIKFQHEGATLE